MDPRQLVSYLSPVSGSLHMSICGKGCPVNTIVMSQPSGSPSGTNFSLLRMQSCCLHLQATSLMVYACGRCEMISQLLKLSLHSDVSAARIVHQPCLQSASSIYDLTSTCKAKHNTNVAVIAVGLVASMRGTDQAIGCLMRRMELQISHRQMAATWKWPQLAGQMRCGSHKRLML